MPPVDDLRSNESPGGVYVMPPVDSVWPKVIATSVLICLLTCSMSATGAPVPVALMEQVNKQMGTDVAITFGQTESTGGITYTPPGDSFERKSSTVGIPHPHMDIKIINPVTGEVVPCGDRGQLCCRGIAVM